METCVIALDAMGGDHAPNAIFQGATLALEKHTDLRFAIFGSEKALAKLHHHYPSLMTKSACHATPDVVQPTDKPSNALRQRQNSSMALAIQAVRTHNAHAVISAGNTGAYMALSRFILKSLPGIDRPAIVKAMPTLQGHSVVLDLGANTECTPRHLFEFALMGGVYAQVVLNQQKPSVGLLNIGSEDIKGGAVLQEASRLCQAHLPPPMTFYGYVEGDNIADGTTDVVVTDGFTGNVALKTAEGTVRLTTTFLKHALQSSLSGRIGGYLAKKAFQRFKQRIDPRRYNGAIFLGLNGIAVKSHGSTDGFGFACAIDVARDMVHGHVIEKMQHALAQTSIPEVLNA